MNTGKKTQITYLNSFLALLLLITVFKFWGATTFMIVLTLLVSIGAIYLSGESFSSLFEKKLDAYSLDELLAMNPYQFEKVVGEYYKSAGYTVLQTRKSGDGGKDLIMYKGGQTYYVECKRYARSRPVSRPTLQKLVGACHPANAKGIFVTTSRFTKEAIDEAKRSGVQLIDGEKFVRMLKSMI